MPNIWGDSGKRTVIQHVTVEVPKFIAPQDTADIDTLMERGLYCISRMMAAVQEQSTSGTFDRETVQNLKDLLSMLGDLKERESELLNNMSDEELQKHANQSKSSRKSPTKKKKGSQGEQTVPPGGSSL